MLFLVSTAAFGQHPSIKDNPDGPFHISIGECTHGHIEVTPEIPAEGIDLPAGTVLKIKANPDEGYLFECGYFAIGGQFAFFTEYFTEDFEVTVTAPGTVGVSCVEPEVLSGYTCKRDIEYARPGVKPLRYDAFIPDNTFGGMEKLPGIVIIHGGGWRMNCQGVMKGMARELCKDGKYAVFSIDYRWNGTADGDEEPNTIADLIEDCYGAILHIQEHAAEYKLDPTRLAVTGDSAGGHLCTSVANMIERIGDGGFGVTEGVYEYLPTYMPEGMTAAQAKQSLMAIKAVAPNYGVFSAEGLARFVQDLPEAGRKAVAPQDNIPDPKVRKIPTWINRGTNDPLITDESTMEYFNALKDAGQRVYYVKVPGAVHAYYDWKPDSATKETFRKFGVPYCRQMEDFFDSVFYD